MNISKKKQLVLNAIKQQPEAANDDALLIATVWYMEGWDDAKDLLTNIRRVTRPETITRRRRELANMGLIKYSEEATNKRQEAFNNERDLHSSYSAVSWLDD